MIDAALRPAFRKSYDVAKVLRGIVTVSYTHLDVYKRQRLDLATGELDRVAIDE